MKTLKQFINESWEKDMSNLELVLNMLAEATTTELAKVHNAQGFAKNQQVAKRGGKIAGDAKLAIEADTGKPVVTSQNAIDFGKLISDGTEESINNE